MAGKVLVGKTALQLRDGLSVLSSNGNAEGRGERGENAESRMETRLLFLHIRSIFGIYKDKIRDKGTVDYPQNRVLDNVGDNLLLSGFSKPNGLFLQRVQLCNVVKDGEERLFQRLHGAPDAQYQFDL